MLEKSTNAAVKGFFGTDLCALDRCLLVRLPPPPPK